MSKIRALLDANVLYPAPLRDLLLQLAVMDVFQARWTEEIHQEWIGALLRNEPQRSPAALDRTRELMNGATRDCLVTGYESFIKRVDLPDVPDRHVVAAPIAGHCNRQLGSPRYLSTTSGPFPVEPATCRACPIL